jgi:hypothetical protein
VYLNVLVRGRGNHERVVELLLQFPELATLAEGNPPEKTQLVSLNLREPSRLPLLMIPISALYLEKMLELTLKTPIVIVLSQKLQNHKYQPNSPTRFARKKPHSPELLKTFK